MKIVESSQLCHINFVKCNDVYESSCPSSLLFFKGLKDLVIQPAIFLFLFW